MCIADCKRIVHLAVGGDLLDVHWWRNPVKRKVMRVNDTDPFETFEPDPSIQRFGYCRRVAPEGRREGRCSVETIEGREWNASLVILIQCNSPTLYVGTRNANQPTLHIQP